MAGENGAENGAASTTGATTAAAVRMSILGQYVRDLSFENALMQRGVAVAEVQHEVQVAVSLDARKRQTEHQYEVVIKFKITSKNKLDGAMLFLIELDYAGVFRVEGVGEEQLHPFLLIECPRMLFPFARRIISDVTRDGGFQPLNLDQVDFLALYRGELQRRMEAQKPAPVLS